ncbi:MAG: pro-sigmaK processing inhibitor BofA family protein [Oscillospiraceae bacterium]
MDMATALKIALLVVGVLLFVVYSRMGRLLRCMLFTAITGLASMGLVWLLGKAFVIGVSITPFSLLTAAVLGLPGVLTMLLIQLI